MPGPIKHTLIMPQARFLPRTAEWMGKSLVCCRVLCISNNAPGGPRGRLRQTERKLQLPQGQVSICVNLLQSKFAPSGAGRVKGIEVRAGLVWMTGLTSQNTSDKVYSRPAATFTTHARPLPHRQ
jgi:hypothetical protein